MSDRRDVRVRRSPKVGVFLAVGAVAGAVIALIAVGSTPPDPQVPPPQALAFLVLLLAPLGALVGGGIAVAIDRVGERRARIVRAERITDEARAEPPLERDLPSGR